MSSTPLSDKGLYAFAPEVRDMIFNDVLSGTWYGETHELIHALRGSKLYLEAIDIFAKTNTYRLHEGNRWTFGDMPQAAINTIRNLEIEFVGGPEARPIRRMFKEKNIAILKHVKSLTLQTSRVVLSVQDNSVHRMTARIWDHERLANMVLKTCNTIANGIFHDDGLYTGLTEFRIFTAGVPEVCGDLHGLHRFSLDRDSDSDWSFELLGQRLIEFFNGQIDKNAKNAVLAWVSASDKQEWLWQCSKGVFKLNVLEPLSIDDFASDQTNGVGYDGSDDSGDAENGMASTSDDSDLESEGEGDDGFF